MKNSFLFFIALFSFNFLFGQKKQNADTLKIEIELLGNSINSSFAEYAPVITADGEMMMFTSRRPFTEKEKKQNKQGYERIYVSTYNQKEWTNALAVTDKVNIKDRNTSNIALSNDGQTLLIYQDDRNGNGDIYESNLSGSQWSPPQSLGEPINSSGHESSASIAPDGRTIYFVSDRTGGAGGRDIWLCSKDISGKWSKPQNIGKNINTNLDEEGVFIHPDGRTLYFSSKGHKSFGGYDIFVSVRDNKGKWSKARNIGNKINSPEDDLFFVLTADGKTAYYASAKKGGTGDKDIYKIMFTPSFTPEQKKPTGPRLTLLKGIISDEITGLLLEAVITITNNQTGEVISILKSNSATGKYLVSLPAGINYGISANSSGYLFHSENVNIPDSASYQEIEKNIKLKKIEVGNKIVLNNIFYDFDKSTLRAESTSELDKLLKLLSENPNIKIEILSHTDDKGTDIYNQNLSQARAQSVVDYLISKGINKERLIAKGYGETNPIISNDTEEGRQLNRRTEFKILTK